MISNATQSNVILVIEDDDDHFELIRRLLQKTTFSSWGLERAASFEEAVHALQSMIPRLILCDQSLPDSHADDTLVRLLEVAHEDSGIVAMTSLNEVPRARAALRAGVLEYLVKGEHNSKYLERSLYYALDRKMLLAELQQRNRELENFVRIVSHDLKSPLGTILLEAQLLERTQAEPNGDVTRAMSSIREECMAMTEIIDSLMAYSRAGWVVGDDIGPTDLEDAARNAIKQLAAEIRKNNVAIDLHSLPPIMGNKRAVTQIFQNLIGNAIRHNESSSPQITLAAEKAGDVVNVKVRDNGVGITSEQIPTIFEMFTTYGKSSASGTGLGLAIVHRLVSLLNGSVSVESEVGKGSEFKLRFPAVPDQAS